METTIKEELTKVQRLSDGKCNYITADGKLLFDKWFEWLEDFDDDFALVERENHQYNYIDKNGKLLSNEWFDCVEYFRDGLAIVQRDDLMNFINKDGKIISDEWFKYVDYFDEYDLAVVERTNGEQAKIDKQGKIVVRK